MTACVTSDGIEVSEPYEVSTYWGYEGFKNTGYRGPKSE